MLSPHVVVALVLSAGGSAAVAVLSDGAQGECHQQTCNRRQGDPWPSVLVGLGEQGTSLQGSGCHVVFVYSTCTVPFDCREVRAARSDRWQEGLARAVEVLGVPCLRPPTGSPATGPGPLGSSKPASADVLMIAVGYRADRRSHARLRARDVGDPQGREHRPAPFSRLESEYLRLTPDRTPAWAQVEPHAVVPLPAISDSRVSRRPVLRLRRRPEAPRSSTPGV